jgi:hypothetical protein
MNYELNEQEILNEMQARWKKDNFYPCPMCFKQPRIYHYKLTWWQKFKSHFDPFNYEYFEKLCIDCECTSTASTQYNYLDIENVKFKWNRLVEPKIKEAMYFMSLYGFEKGYQTYRRSNDNLFELHKIRYYFSDKPNPHKRCDDEIRMAKYLF